MRQLIIRLTLGCLIPVGAFAMPLRKASAGLINGDDPYEFCTAPANEILVLHECLGYIAGVSDVLWHNAVNGYRACEGKVVVGNQIRDVVVLYLSRHPDFRSFGAEGLVARALSEAFPANNRGHLAPVPATW